jgi:hypothetical protein
MPRKRGRLRYVERLRWPRWPPGPHNVGCSVDICNVTPLFAFYSERGEGLRNAASAPGRERFGAVDAALLGEL